MFYVSISLFPGLHPLSQKCNLETLWLKLGCVLSHLSFYSNLFKNKIIFFWRKYCLFIIVLEIIITVKYIVIANFQYVLLINSKINSNILLRICAYSANQILLTYIYYNFIKFSGILLHTENVYFYHLNNTITEQKNKINPISVTMCFQISWI